MRRRRKNGNSPRKGKKKETEGKLESKGDQKTEIVEESGMSVTAMDVVDTTTHNHFGHGHQHHFHAAETGVRQTTPTLEMDLISTTPPQNGVKAVGARKRKPTQISKIVDKPSSEVESVADDNGTEEPLYPLHNNNNNNSPPYKKPYVQSGESRNGMIQNIVTELKCAKKASSKLDSLFPNHPSQSTISGDFTSEDEEEDEDESLRIDVDEEEEGQKKKSTIERANRNREEKVDLANIRTLLSSTIKSKSDKREEEGIDMRSYRNECREDSGDPHLQHRCGVCHFGTPDRAVLLRHMKSHSGDRSFQCRLCSFAFTTKANCERHLRNRHGQIEKDQIRSLVVVFSSSSSESETETSSNHHRGSRSPSSTSSIPIHKNATSGGLLLQHRKPRTENGINLTNVLHRPVVSPNTVGQSLVSDDEQPLDLSMDAVDLSTKHRKNESGGARASLLRPRPIYPTADMSNLLATSPFVTKREPMAHPQLPLPIFADDQYNSLFNSYSPFATNAMRAPDLSGATTNSQVPSAQPFPLFPFSGTSTYNPFSFPTQTMEKVSSGLSNNIPSPSKTTSAFIAPSPPTSFESRESLPTTFDKELKLKSAKKEVKAETSSVSSASPTTSRKRSDTKNGDYQKPKQRRYRTERPFSCPHCPARFTLRSNMERHGKHQHPNVWQRSPSNRVINRQQKNQQSSLAGPPTMVPGGKYNASGMDLKMKNRNSPLNGENGCNVDVRAVIAQQLKRKLSNSAMLNGGGAESGTESDNNGAESGRGIPHDSSDLASVSQLLDRVKNSNIAQYFHEQGTAKSLTNSEDNEEDLSGTETGSGCSSDEGEGDEAEEVNDKEGKAEVGREKKKSAYSSAPHKISCPHCTRRFPWTSSLRRHLLTHTGQKPYQCSKCPLLFTTKSNCDRHLARKHSGKGKTSGSGYNTTEDDEDEGEEEGQIHEDGHGGDNGETTQKIVELQSTPARPIISIPPKAVNSTNSSPGEDVSFRCHLCEASASEREILLTHMEEEHKETFHLLVSKGALTSSPPSENSEAEPQQSTPPSDLKETTNRKVVCVFCVRRFWSVEDLRRHIRSHSGERPFSCPHCSRRFTLKHSMLRHLKKHVVDELQTTQTPRGRKEISKKKSEVKSEEVEETNLISRLLGIHDEGLVEQLLNKPDAKDAAKLLGLRMGLAKQNTSLTTSN